MHEDEPSTLKVAHPNGYFTDLITEKAEEIIKTNGNDRPLFLEISHLAAHASEAEDPLEVRSMAEVNATFPYIRDINRRRYAGNQLENMN